MNWKATNAKTVSSRAKKKNVVSVHFDCNYRLWLLQEVRWRRNQGTRSCKESGTAKEKDTLGLANLTHL